MADHKGSCHCGAVSFNVKAPTIIKANECNCSICKATGFIHLIVEKEDFTLLSGETDITTYSFNTHTAKHTFCKHCGIKSFYTPRSHPNGYSINVNCLDLSTIETINYGKFDGDNWEDNVDALRKDLT
ncbi:MAG: GFA family protein [Kordiimonadaceae bacterium]|jgi:hypothetical protein|nr:GFA family protein [Kordiimonadaceae bacterium]MBT6031915.1 GFA family protein [Kordiimonadaceae bacterium]